MTLEALFAPHTVAVVGASPGKGGFGNLAIANLRAHGFAGAIHAIHPQASEVDGVAAVSQLAALPVVPDHCVIGVRADLVAGVLRECVALGVPAVTVVASGFAEQGDEAGRQLQRTLHEIVAGSRTRVVGPNTIGVANFHGAAAPIASANVPQAVTPGPVAIVSQSGGLGATVLLRGLRQGMGFSHLATLGNELDVTAPEVIEYLARDAAVRVIIVYLEAVRDAAAFHRALAVCRAQNKRLIVLKGGLTSAGAAAALSHTGALAGNGAVWNSVIQQSGAIAALSIDHALATAKLFVAHGVSPGRRLLGCGVSGGLTVLLADMLARERIELAVLSEESKASIRKALPDVTPGNPFDVGGYFLSGDGSALSDALSAVAVDGQVDALAFLFPAILPARQTPISMAIARSARGLPKPVVVLSYLGHSEEDIANRVFKDCGIPVLDPPEAGLQALKSWLAFAPPRPAEALAHRTTPRSEEAVATLHSAAALGQQAMLEDEAKRLLRRYGVTCPEEEIVDSAQHAVAAAERMGYPVALKILSPQLLHRGVGDGVLLGLSNQDALRAAYAQLRARAAGLASARLLVQRQVPPGDEFLIGAIRDADLGLTLAIAHGGASVEESRDTLFCAIPVEPSTLHHALLQWLARSSAGAGQPSKRIDFDAFAQTVQQIAALLADAGDVIQELDVNPVIVGAPGEGAVAVDALVILRPAAAP